MSMEVTIACHGEDETDQGCLGTAMHAVHAIAPVCASAPGIVTFLDLPMVIGTGERWRRRTDRWRRSHPGRLGSTDAASLAPRRGSLSI